MLLNKVNNITSEREGEEFLDNHSFSKSLSDHFNEFFSSHPDLKTADVIRESCISREYAYEILNGKKDRPGRDKIIALCISCGMSLKETNRALSLSGNNELYIKNDRDAALIMCVNFRSQGKPDFKNISFINGFLTSRGFDELS